MIAGFNTDVRHAGAVFHVQTEDKGLDNPSVESLVYVGGQVLAARRAQYGELLGQDGSKAAIEALMEQQHRSMIAAIRLGRFDAKMKEIFGDRPSTQPTQVVEAQDGDATVEEAVPDPGDGVAEPAERTAVDDILMSTRITEAERTLDQVILEYLNREAEQERLVLSVAEPARLEPGLPSSLTVAATSSKSGEPVSGAKVRLRLLSSAGPAQPLAAGITSEKGTVVLQFSMPRIESGKTALFATAESNELGFAELKQIL